MLALVKEGRKLLMSRLTGISWMKRLSGISLVLIIIFVASYSHSLETIVEKMDVDKNHLVKLEAGEQATIELSKIGYYMAIRYDVIGEEEKSELKLTDSKGVEIEGREPGIIESYKRTDSNGNPVYLTVRVFEINNNGDYNLINQGNTTLWLVDVLEVQSSLYSDGWIMASMISFCLGLPLGLFTLILGLITWKRKKNSPEKKIVFQENIMTTDELFKKQNSAVEIEENIPAPFVVPSDKWENWDDGE